MGSFTMLIFASNGVTMDLNQQLVGQAGGLFVKFGDFNLLGIGGAPRAIFPNALATNGGSGDPLVLQSFIQV
jgi:hypothetical protein